MKPSSKTPKHLENSSMHDQSKARKDESTKVLRIHPLRSFCFMI
jgi:hypothetical protein